MNWHDVAGLYAVQELQSLHVAVFEDVIILNFLLLLKNLSAAIFHLY